MQHKDVVVPLQPEDAEPDANLTDDSENAEHESEEIENQSIELIKKHFPGVDTASINMPEGFRLACNKGTKYASS